jgi:hypothetical protein
LAQVGFAKDGVPVIGYPLNPSQYGAESTAYRLWCATGSTRITDWGQLTNLGPNLLIDNVTVTSGSPTITVPNPFPSTVAANDQVSGPGIPSGTTVNSVAGTSAVLSNDATTSGTVNLVITTTGKLAAGQGSLIGVPVRIMAINTASGVESTFANYAESGVTGGGCSSNMNTNGASDPNPVTATGTNATPQVALQNKSDQTNSRLGIFHRLTMSIRQLRPPRRSMWNQMASSIPIPTPEQ